MATLLISVSSAQETEPTTTTVAESPAPDANEVKSLKKIVITGSYIRRAVDEGSPTPVAQIDNTKAQEAGSYSAGGIMRDNAVVSSGGSSNVSFHGQSSANNLVLLNGLRLPKLGGNESVNIDFIPASAIERVEILKDGASALYGSEALAGVVNIITKKEYDGANITARYTMPEMGKGPESNVIATYGKTFNGGNFLGTFQFRNNQPVFFRDTEYGMTNVKTAGSDASSPGNLMRGSNYFRAADCPADRIGSRGECRYDYYDRNQITSEDSYYNVLLSSGFDLGNNLRLEASTVYTHQASESINSPAILRFEDLSGGGGIDNAITGTMANNWSGDINGNPAFNPSDKMVLLYSADEELGDRKNRGRSDTAVAQVKLGRESENFDWDVALGYSLGNYRDTLYSGNARKDLIFDKMKANAFNPFAPTGNKDSLADARIETWSNSFADAWNGRAIASGRLWNLGDKSVYAAFGVEQQFQSYRYRGDFYSRVNLAATGTITNQDGRRDVTSTFLELTQNPIPDLQLQLAGRFDKYSDFGSTVNPKVAAAYRVTDEFMIRGSYGTGFKAPDLRALYQGETTRTLRLRDEVICSKPGGNSNPACNNLYPIITAGDPDLEEERGEHFNFGFQIRPKKNWQISLDHWRAHGTNSLETVSLNRLTNIEAQYGPGMLNSLGIDIVRDTTTDIIQYVRIPLRTNAGRYNVNGLDLDIKYRSQFQVAGLGSVGFTFRFDHSHLLDSGSQSFFFVPYTNQINLSWKNVTSFAFTKGNHLASWRVRTFSARDKDSSMSLTNVGLGSIPTYGEHDLHYEYFGAWNGVITVGVRNILDKKYYNEFNNGRPDFLLSASDTQLGRTFYVGYSQDF